GTSITPGDPLNIRLLGKDVYTAYNDLVRFLRDEGGYVLDRDLFTFGYDWRLDLMHEVARLRVFLFRFNQTDRMDVVAHSMGGLLIRAYLERYPDDQRIANVIYLGTPQRGAPMAYAKLIGAANMVTRFNGQFGEQVGPLAFL